MPKFCSKIAVVFSIVFLSSCGFYSFTGASISPDVKTVAVQYFPNRAATIQPTLSQVFTERLKDYFLEQTNLISNFYLGLICIQRDVFFDPKETSLISVCDDDSDVTGWPAKSRRTSHGRCAKTFHYGATVNKCFLYSQAFRINI